MPKLSTAEKNQNRQRYNQLKSLIERRLQDESDNPDSAKNKYPTDYTFSDANGYDLLDYAVMMGDLETVKNLKSHFSDISTAAYFSLKYGELEIFSYLSKFLSEDSKLVLVDAYFDLDEARKFQLQLAPQNYEDPYLVARHAIKLGDTHSLLHYLNSTSAKYFDKKLLLQFAVELAQHECVRVLKEHVIEDNIPETKALHIAARHGDWDSANILLDNSNLHENRRGYYADINARDENGHTPLHIALASGQEEFARQLLKNFPNVKLDTTDNQGNSLWHAMMNCSAEFRAELSSRLPESSQHEPNIFSEKPEDINSQLGSISQNRINANIRYYLRLNYRDDDYIDKGGQCNGFVFLHQYFHQQGKLELFNAILDALAKLDPSDSNPPPLEAPLTELFKDQEECFETVIAWLSWYQASSNVEAFSTLKQFDREQQYEGQLDYVIKNLRFEQLYPDQLLEIMELLACLPSSVHAEFDNKKHIVAANMDAEKEGRINYYDPNHRATLAISLTPRQLTRLYVHELSPEGVYSVAGIEGTGVSLYYFDSGKQLANYSYFDGSSDLRAFPSDEESYNNFTKASKNKFTPLHIAALSHSYVDLQKLLELDFIDVNAKDVHGRTPLDIAIHSRDENFIKLLLEHPELDLNYSNALKNAWDILPSSTFLNVLERPQVTDAKMLLDHFLETNFLSGIDYLLEENKLSAGRIGYLYLLSEDKDHRFELLDDGSIERVYECYLNPENFIAIAQVCIEYKDFKNLLKHCEIMASEDLTMGFPEIFKMCLEAKKTMLLRETQEADYSNVLSFLIQNSPNNIPKLECDMALVLLKSLPEIDIESSPHAKHIRQKIVDRLPASEHLKDGEIIDLFKAAFDTNDVELFRLLVHKYPQRLNASDGDCSLSQSLAFRFGNLTNEDERRPCQSEMLKVLIHHTTVNIDHREITAEDPRSVREILLKHPEFKDELAEPASTPASPGPNRSA